MKKILSLLSATLLMMTTLMGVVCFGVSASAEEVAEDGSVILNVKDFGAVGDGKTDDEAAIWATFECALMDYMVNDIPVTVYFPEGQYGLKNGGLYVYLPRGAGNLTVKGDGADKSTIVYLEEWTNSGSWVALRIYPRITPTSVDEYLHDITIQDLGVYDTDPLAHAWHKDKGDPDTEETHGFNIQYCVRATIRNCKVDSVGDEAIDMSHCIDSVMTDNVVLNSPGAGSAGGAISVGDGSKNVRITNNAVMGSINDSTKMNWAIAVEALTEHVEDVKIEDNAIQNIAGWGVNIGAPNGTIANVIIRSNTIDHCRDGGVRFMGSGQTTDVQLLENTITDTRSGIFLDGSNKIGTLIDGCVIEDVSNYAVNIKSPNHCDNVIQNTVIRNAKWRALYNAGVNTTVDRLFVDGSGTAGNITDSAVIQYTGGGDCTISNSVFLNCQNKRGIQGINKVVNTYIEQPEKSGYTAISGTMYIQDCYVNRLVTAKSGCTIDGLTLYTEVDLGTHAIVLSNLTDCTVKNCHITIPSRYGISEAGTADRNTITNNVIVGGSGIKTTGADTVATGNVRATKAATEQFVYRVVDGEVAVMAPLDPTLTVLDIPAAIGDCPVTAIDPWAFALCGSLSSVSLRDSVTVVDDHAFYGCDSFTEVYYTGSTADWDKMLIEGHNTPLLDAVHYNNCVTILPGDLDDDGSVNNRDLGLLQQYLNDHDITLRTEATDVNGDGDVNNRDLGLLMQYVNGWNVTLSKEFLLPPLDPWYVQNMQSAAAEYTSKRDGSALTFSMMSDMHLRPEDSHVVDNVEASSFWADAVGNDFILMSGDFIIGDLNKQTSLGLIDTAVEAATKYATVPVYAVKGNHDTNEDYKIGTDPETGKAVYSTADRITDEEFYAHAIAQSESTIVTDPANPYGGYYYVNFSKQKVRLICLNTTEIHSYVDILDSTKNDFRSNGALSFEQTTWLANTALQVPDGWAVMVVAHIPPITGANVGVENETTADAPFHTRGIRNSSLTALLEAFATGGRGNVQAKKFENGVVKTVSIPYDFTVLQGVEFIGHFSGHIHEDSHSVFHEINYVVVNCTTPQKRWDTSLDREAGTETALSLNSFIIDRETRTVECIKVGTGESYSFTW